MGVKKTYFISDAHLGSWAIKDDKEKERHLVKFLDSVKDDAAAIYMLGDMFDFWHEYKLVVPKGFTRFLGKLSELSDSGVELHFLTGNHDMWVGDYLKEECGVNVHKDKLMEIVINGHRFCLAHGDGLDKNDYSYLMLRYIFHNSICQKLFASIHPRWAMHLGFVWAKHSRMKHIGQEGILVPEEKDRTLAFAREYVEHSPETEYFIIGHRHVDQQTTLPNGATYIVLGEWITKFTVATFDGEKISISHFEKQE